MSQWHTFWNAGEEPAAVIELISPAGLETFFRELGLRSEPIDPDELAELARPYECDADIEASSALLATHDLRS